MNDDLSVHVNHLGHKQFRNDVDEDVCPECLKPYTNEGEGVICAQCGSENDK